MATDKQIAANRANAKRSTGPKTAAGRAISRNNAYRHGLSLQLDALTSAKADAIAQALVAEQTNENLLKSASSFAQAQLQILRIRSVRVELLSKAELNDSGTQALRRIVALDRYERYSLTKRRRASKILQRKMTMM